MAAPREILQSPSAAKHRARRHSPLTAARLLDKAQRAIESAAILLGAGDLNGACNRAYYAMFHAARAALMSAQTLPTPADVKTHVGLICAFSLQLVKSGRVPVELGKAFSKVADMRLMVDYSNEEIGAERAGWAIEQAQAFLEAMRARCTSAIPPSSPAR